jgi:hypothetical protein
MFLVGTGASVILATALVVNKLQRINWLFLSLLNG